MAEFYNKYRRLFTEPDHPQKNLNAFTVLPNTYKTPNANHIDRYFKDSNQEDTIFKRQQKIGRSPALDEFENYVLPRLKTEPDAVDRKGAVSMQSPLSSPYSRLPSISFDSKPRNFTGLKRDEPVNLINSPKILKFQQWFTDNRNKINVPQSVSGPKYNLNVFKQQILNPPKIQKTPQYAIYPKKQRNYSYFEPQRQREEQSGGKKTNRQTNLYESQLYGLNENPYAFANSKLSDIRLIQRFYPKGIVNQYKECLLRRHQKKNELSQRRDQLRQLLQKDTPELTSGSK